MKTYRVWFNYKDEPGTIHRAMITNAASREVAIAATEREAKGPIKIQKVEELSSTSIQRLSELTVHLKGESC